VIFGGWTVCPGTVRAARRAITAAHCGSAGGVAQGVPVGIAAGSHPGKTLICTEPAQIEAPMEPVLSPARKLAAALLLLSGVTHVAQLAVYPGQADVIGAAMFGVLYLALGAYLLQPKRAALWLAAIFPLIGGSLGVLRFLKVRPNPFSVLHVGIDIVVISICIFLLLRRGAPASTA
jgi:uncharacterized membrane protein SirB2